MGQGILTNISIQPLTDPTQHFVLVPLKKFPILSEDFDFTEFLRNQGFLYS